MEHVISTQAMEDDRQSDYLCWPLMREQMGYSLGGDEPNLLSHLFRGDRDRHLTPLKCWTKDRPANNLGDCFERNEQSSIGAFFLL